MRRHVTAAERRIRLARRHLLLPEDRADGPDAVAAVADALVGLHSTDPVTVYLSAMVRMRHPSVDTVEHALYVERAVVRHHAMRRTLWVATPDVVRLMHAAATGKLVGPEHRRTAKLLAQNGVPDPEAWLADARVQVLAALAEHGPLTARALGTTVPALIRKIVMAPGTAYSATVSAHTRVLLNLGFEGEVVRAKPTGTWINGAYTYATMDSWLAGGLGDLSEREAACGLALRWLHSFGPGTTTDLQWWTGWTLATAKRAVADCGAVEADLDGGPGWLAPGDEAAPEPVGPWVALLPGLDPTTMGWKERDFYLPASAAAAFDRMGNAGPTIWADGQVVGVWAQTQAGELRTHLFVDLASGQRQALARRVEDVTAILGDARFTVRFPSPVSAALAKGTPPPT